MLRTVFLFELACYVLKEGKVNWDQSIINILSRGWRCLPWGYFLMTFGIALSCKADLGTSPISSVPWVMSMFLPFSLGDITIMMNIVMILAQPLILRALYVKGAGGPAADDAGFLAAALIFQWVCWTGLYRAVRWSNGLLAFLSIVVLALGVFLEVRAKIFLVAGEGVVSVLAFVTQKKFSLIKNCFDISLVTLAIIISWVEFGTLQGVGAGTVVAAVLVGRFVHLYESRLSFFDRWKVEA